MSAEALIRTGQLHPAQPWPRYALTSQAWAELARALPAAGLAFQGLWADAAQVFALFTAPEPLLVSAPVEAGWYAALSPGCPGASLFERMVADLWGHSAADARDARPWLDHSVWPMLRPLAARPVPNGGLPEPPEFLPASGDAHHAGPVRPGLGEPARLRLTVQGERIVRAEARLGYAHRGALSLMRGKRLDEAAAIAARLSGGATVAHSLAFARAAEAALGAAVPPRAAALREVMAALERVGMGLHAMAARQEAAGHEPAQSLTDREMLLRAAHQAFGHRLMMDLAVPGGMPRDIAADGPAAILSALGRLTPRPHWRAFPDTDAAITRDAADAAALLVALPDGDFRAFPPSAGGEGLGRAESAGGTVWHWMRLDGGRIAECFARDPAWLAWPQAEAAAAGATLAAWPSIEAAHRLAVGGMDL